MNQSKTSVISAKNNHHDSKGLYFSFGNKARYKTIDGSSIGQYTNKKNVTVEQKMKFLVIEDLVARELKDGIMMLGSLIPLLKEYIAPIFGVADKMQLSKGNINIKADKYAKYGIYKSVFCVNAETEELHTENDCSYTVISTPRRLEKKPSYHFNFLFQFNSLDGIYFEMDQPITFMFSGKLLMHRQFCNSKVIKKDKLFFNFATYTNKKIFNHVKCSFGRVSKDPIINN